MQKMVPEVCAGKVSDNHSISFETRNVFELYAYRLRAKHSPSSPMEMFRPQFFSFPFHCFALFPAGHFWMFDRPYSRDIFITITMFSHINRNGCKLSMLSQVSGNLVEVPAPSEIELCFPLRHADKTRFMATTYEASQWDQANWPDVAKSKSRRRT